MSTWTLFGFGGDQALQDNPDSRQPALSSQEASWSSDTNVAGQSTDIDGHHRTLDALPFNRRFGGKSMVTTVAATTVCEACGGIQGHASTCPAVIASLDDTPSSERWLGNVIPLALGTLPLPLPLSLALALALALVALLGTLRA